MFVLPQMSLYNYQMKSPDGTPKYTERLVCDWLERIRLMGWEQGFEK